MTRRNVAVFLVLAMVWQWTVLARVTGQEAVAAASRLEHSLLHWTSREHRHRPDGTVVKADTTESARHLMADHVNAHALLPSLALVTPQPYAIGPSPAPTVDVPAPFLETPLKPPKRTTPV